MASTIVYKDANGDIICKECSRDLGPFDFVVPVILEDIGDGCPECVPMFCDSCSEPLRVEKF